MCPKWLRSWQLQNRFTYIKIAWTQDLQLVAMRFSKVFISFAPCRPWSTCLLCDCYQANNPDQNQNHNSKALFLFLTLKKPRETNAMRLKLLQNRFCFPGHEGAHQRGCRRVGHESRQKGWDAHHCQEHQLQTDGVKKENEAQVVLDAWGI